MQIWQSLRASAWDLVTSNLVVAESHALILRRAHPDLGRSFLTDVGASPHARVVWVDESLTADAAAHWIHGQPDKSYSLTDAVSFEVMRQEHIGDAFSFDVDFERAGFRLVKS